MTSAIDLVLAKERQARRHWEDLYTDIQAFLGAHPPRTEGNLSADDREYVITVHDVHAVPERIALLIGDVVHNARSCLDHLAVRLASKPNYKTSFPILSAERRDKQTGTPHPTTIIGGVSEAVREVVVSVQPYIVRPDVPNRHPLAVLRELDNMDKHRIIVPTLSAFPAAADGWLDGVGRHRRFNFGPLQEGAWVARYQFGSPSPSETVAFRLLPCVALGRDTPLQDGDDVVKVLDLLMRHVVTTVRKFEQFLQG